MDCLDISAMYSFTSAQHHAGFCHNDLHIQNVMYIKTDYEKLTYKLGNEFYQVPTYGIIIKIVDFGRSTFVHDEKLYMGDVFRKRGEAGEQYTFPYEEPSKQYFKHKPILPNYSFDLSRFACSFMEDYYSRKQKNDPLYDLLILGF